jgi:hypothetical protein
VDPKVIKEVVPFPEVLSTTILVALEDLDEALALGIFEGEDAERLSRWHVLLYLH